MEKVYIEVRKASAIKKVIFWCGNILTIRYYIARDRRLKTISTGDCQLEKISESGVHALRFLQF